jgi:hypothetical protein
VPVRRVGVIVSFETIFEMFFSSRVAFDSWQPEILDATPSREGGRLLDDLGAFHHLESMCTGLAPSAFIDRSSVHASLKNSLPRKGRSCGFGEAAPFFTSPCCLASTAPSSALF